MSISANKLTDFVNKEDKPVVWPLLVKILANPLAEVLNGYGKLVFRPIDPFLRRVLALAGGGTPGFDNLIVIELISVPFAYPIAAAGSLEGVLENLQLVLGL